MNMANFRLAKRSTQYERYCIECVVDGFRCVAYADTYSDIVCLTHTEVSGKLVWKQQGDSYIGKCNNTTVIVENYLFTNRYYVVVQCDKAVFKLLEAGDILKQFEAASEAMMHAASFVELMRDS